MFDPYDPQQMQRLYSSFRASHRSLEPHRRKRRELIDDFTGSWSTWKSNTSDVADEMPVNMMALTVDIYLMHLAGNSPQVILPTGKKDLMQFAADMEAVVNKQLEKMDFSKILRRWVLEAIFGIGVAKCGLSDADYVEIVPGSPQPGQEYFVEVVDFDDFVYDTDARAWDKIRFIGDRYKVDYDTMMEAGDYEESGKKSLEVAEKNYHHDTDGGQRADSIVVTKDSDITEQELWKRTAWVWDICLPEEGIVVTVADNVVDKVAHPLKVVEWQGPTTTPYHTLQFTEIPSSTMPLPPGQVLKGLNRAINALYRKLIKQAGRQKTVAMYREGEEQDAEKIQKAQDGEIIGVSHPDSIKEVMFGGAAQENLGFSMQLMDTFSRMAGNLDALGGLGPQSETFKQDQMISEQAGQKTAKMTRAVVDGTAAIVRDLMYNIWHDPVGSYNAERNIQGTDVNLEVVLNPGERPGSFDDLDVKIEPYSMTYRSPSQRAGEIQGIIMNMAVPLMPMLQQQGISINVQRLFEYLSKYMALPELNNILEYSGVPMPGQEDTSSQKPANTTRTYEHTSRPGASREGNSGIMQQLLAGGNPQQSEVAALGRPTGA